MNNQYKEILSYYEDLKLHTGTLYSKEGFFDYQPYSSLHSEVTAFAYGIRETKSSFAISPAQVLCLFTNPTFQGVFM